MAGGSRGVTYVPLAHGERRGSRLRACEWQSSLEFKATAESAGVAALSHNAKIERTSRHSRTVGAMANTGSTPVGHIR